MKISFPDSGVEIALLAIISIALLLTVGSLLGSVLGLLVFGVKSIFRIFSGLVKFAFDSVFNLLLVGGLGFLVYRWYENKNKKKEEFEDREAEIYSLEVDEYE
uniref:Membrane protein n=1 Tax=uncultured organism TaxID=155900 RepID=M1PP09_9ZZZZ|nr:membrane protein [uncultured organism]